MCSIDPNRRSSDANPADGRDRTAKRRGGGEAAQAALTEQLRDTAEAARAAIDMSTNHLERPHAALFTHIDVEIECAIERC